MPRFDDYYNQQNERSKNIPVPSKNSQNDGGLVGFSVNNSNNRVTIVDIPLDNEQAPTGTTNYASDDRRDGVLNHNHRLSFKVRRFILYNSICRIEMRN